MGFLAIAASAAWSILGLGFLWIGKLSGEACVAALYLLLAYLISHYQGSRAALLATVAPAAPVAALIVMFRDPNDSHLGSIAIVLAWLLGMTLGAFAADRARTSLKRLFACVAVMSLAHAVVTVYMVMAGFGSAMQFFGGNPGSPYARQIDIVTDILMQPVLGMLAGGPDHLPAAGQWIVFGINSLTWGALLGVLLALALRIKRPVPAATAG